MLAHVLFGHTWMYMLERFERVGICLVKLWSGSFWVVLSYGLVVTFLVVLWGAVLLFKFIYCYLLASCHLSRLDKGVGEDLTKEAKKSRVYGHDPFFLKCNNKLIKLLDTKLFICPYNLEKYSVKSNGFDESN